MRAASVLSVLPALTLAPLLLGLIARTKAVVAGRCGPPLLQPYYELAKLLGKGAVYSHTTTWIFRAGPMVGVVAVGIALMLVPLGRVAAPLAFRGDLILFLYLLALLRFFAVLAALDTGSSFEGMGASREVTLSALAEPVLLLGLAALVRLTGGLSLSEIYAGIDAAAWRRAAPSLSLVAAALLVVFLAENARIPVDDPTTHLELTMIHEVMVLDHGGVDFAFILYAGALKLWVLGVLLVGLLVPVHSGNGWLDGGATVAGLFLLAVLVGLIESSMARWRLSRVPQLLIGAGVLSTLALVLL